MDGGDESHEVGLVAEVGSLVKRYEELVAVDSLPLTIPRGQVPGLLGPDGSSKVMTVSCILQLLTHDKGSIRVFDGSVTPTSYGPKHRIDVVPQDVAVFDEFTVVENVSAFCAFYVRDHVERCRLVVEVVAFVSLEKLVRFKPKKLSGGLLRRHSIACGIAHDPDLVFLDKPTIATDLQSQGVILEGIKCLNERGTTVIYTSHYMEEAERLCDRIVTMDRGRQMVSGTPNELKAMIGTGECIRVEVVDPASLDEKVLEGLHCLEHVRTAAYQDDGVLIEYSLGAYNLTDVVRALDAAGATCGRVTSRPPILNDVFLEITGRALRDEVA